MIGAAVENASAPPARSARELVRSVDHFTLGIGLVVLGQVIWLGVLMNRGWYYQADLANLAQATGRPLSWGYLSSPQGGHFGVPGRLLFWLLNRTTALNYPATIVLRLIVQLATTVVLARLLVLLVGRRPAVVAVVALYAFSPLLIQNELWLTAAVGFLPSQLLVLLALHSHVRYVLTRKLAWAAGTALALFAAVSLGEQSATYALVLPLLSLGFLHSGSGWNRVRELLRCWPEWLMIGLPILAYAVYFLGSDKYTSQTNVGLGVVDALGLIRTELSASVAPAMIGGPFSWFSGPDNAQSLAVPSTAVQILAGLLVIALIAFSVRRTGGPALLAWAMPLVSIVVGILIVGLGRFDALGVLVAHQYEHTAYVALPLTLALGLALWPGSSEQIRERLEAASPLPAPVAPRFRRRLVVASALVASVLAASGVSSIKYSGHWANNPTRRYVDTLAAALHRAGPGVQLYDTAVNGAIIAPIEPNHSVSDLVALMGARARFDVPGGDLQIVRPDGTIGPAVILPAATGQQPAGPSCAVIARGVGTWRITLTPRPMASEYFVTLSYLQAMPSVVSITVQDAAGDQRAPVHGSRVTLPGQLGTLARRLPVLAPRAVIVHSDSLATNVCISDVVVGAPIPAPNT